MNYIFLQIWLRCIKFPCVYAKKCIGDHSLVFPIEEVNVKDSFSYKEEPITILDRKVRKLRSKDIVSIKVLWKNQKAKEAT